ncbi:MAG: hypothetical protein GWM89_03365 [Candidatus Dadabacteria bacterium]|nr:hypothetical protein [Candidatus Dadabacteria bacterium]NIY21466.1 hypothetical protein [Candidatus Dadabacteria bacterium]
MKRYFNELLWLEYEFDRKLTQKVLQQSYKLGNKYIISNQGDYEEKVMCVEGVIEKLSDMKETAVFEACDSLDGELGQVCEAAAIEKMYRLNKPTMSLYLN